MSTATIARVGTIEAVHSNNNINNNNNGAMAILDKYTQLNRLLEEARHETLEKQDRIDHIHDQLHDIQQDRETMMKERRLAQQDTQQFHDNLDLNFGSSLSFDRSHSHDTTEKIVINMPSLLPLIQRSLRLEIMQQQHRQHRQEFLEHSRLFRRKVQRLRWTATQLGMEMAPLNAWLDTHDIHIEQESDMEQELQQQQDDKLQLSKSEECAEWHQEATTEHYDHDDSQMKEALGAYQLAWTKHTAATSMLQNVNQSHEIAQHRSQARQSRQQQLKAQLDRIQRDTATLEHTLLELQQETQLAQGMSDGFRQRAEQKQNERPKNPYTPACDQQTSHRRYVDRQFKTSVGVLTKPNNDKIGVSSFHQGMFQSGNTTVESDDDNDDILSFAPFQCYNLTGNHNNM